MTEDLHKKEERLFRAILSLRTEEECRAFLSDLLTVRELMDFASRLEVADMLDNKMTYQEIAQQTGISTATISRVSRCLFYGDNGYRTVLDRMKNGKNYEERGI